jgi:hypothetical protein
MTDHLTPASPDEELSAAIDGELDPTRAAALDGELAADGARRARRDELARVAARVGVPVAPLSADAVDDLVATALDAPLAPAAARPSRGPSPLLVAAAITLLVAVGLGLVWSGRGSETEDRASTSESAPAEVANDAGAGADASAGAATESADEGGTGADSLDSLTGDGTESGAPTSTIPPTSSAVAAPLELGSFATAEELRTALATTFAPAPATSGEQTERTQAPPTAAQVERCGTQLQVTLELDDVAQQAGYGTVDGEPVLVYEFAAPSFADGSPTTLIAAVGTDSCQQVVLFER